MPKDLMQVLKDNNIPMRTVTPWQRFKHWFTNKHDLVPLYRYSNLDQSMSQVGFVCDVCGYEA